MLAGIWSNSLYVSCPNWATDAAENTFPLFPWSSGWGPSPWVVARILFRRCSFHYCDKCFLKKQLLQMPILKKEAPHTTTSHVLLDSPKECAVGCFSRKECLLLVALLLVKVKSLYCDWSLLIMVRAGQMAWHQMKQGFMWSHLGHIDQHTRPVSYRTFCSVFGKTNRTICGIWLAGRVQLLALLDGELTLSTTALLFFPIFITSVLIDYKGASSFRECQGD